MRISQIAVLAVMMAAPCSAEPRADLAAACFSPAELVVQAGERRVVRVAERDAGPPAVAGTPAPAAPRGAIRRVWLPPGQKLIALTFDFCEQPGEVAGYDGAILDYLRANRVKATLFVGGRWMTTHPVRTEQMIADPLFEMASHGWGHRNTRLLAGAELFREITGPSRAYLKARADLGQRACVKGNPGAFATVPGEIRLFRFPFGACSPAGLDAVAAAGLLPIQWDVSTGDPWPGQTAAAIAAVMVRQTRPGSIILAHANGRGHNTAAALPLAIPRLKAMGYSFVTVSELIAAGRPEVVDQCYDSRPGDTDKYDRLFPVTRRPVEGADVRR